jgi:4-amino-4-deoxy-L-arabinose transferase-like glycosyltransferase
MPDPARARPTTLLALAAVVLGACGLAASTWHVFGHTWDEPEHIAAGMALIDHGHYDYDIQHPPLGRVLLALGPYLAGARSQGKPPPDGMPEGRAILYGSGHYDLYLTLARAGALPFLALLIVVTYAWARRLLEPWGALLAAALLAATPVVLGHGALATLDVPAAATCLLALFATQRWLESGRFADALFVGAATGLAVGTKLSAIPFVGLGAVALVIAGSWQRQDSAHRPPPVAARTRLGGLLAASLLVGVVLTFAYGGRFIYLTDATHRYNQALGYLFGYAGPVHDAAYHLFAKIPVPEAAQWIVGGIEALTVHNRSGHLSYLLGTVGTTGWWYFYPVALAVKTPLPLLLLGTAGLGLLARDGVRRRDPWALAPLGIVTLLVGFASLVSHINIGVRHVLLVYPFLAIGGAFAIGRAWRAIVRWPAAGPRRAAMAGLALLLLWQLSPLARAWPDYLPYFNELARDPAAVLVDSDLDWGQDLRRLARRLGELKVERVALAYLGTADLSREGLPRYVLLRPDERATGWVAVSALARMHAPGRFGWLDAYRRRERIGRTIDLYLVPPDAP